MTRLPKLKISWRRGKQYTSPVTIGGGIIEMSDSFVFSRDNTPFSKKKLRLQTESTPKDSQTDSCYWHYGRCPPGHHSFCGSKGLGLPYETLPGGGGAAGSEILRQTSAKCSTPAKKPTTRTYSS